jgi:hypothetical protein
MTLLDNLFPLGWIAGGDAMQNQAGRNADEVTMKAATGVAIANDRSAWFVHNGSPLVVGLVVGRDADSGGADALSLPKIRAT